MERLQTYLNSRPKLLLVDDQSLNIRLLHELFRAECDVYMATSGEQALKMSRDLFPDLILLDVMMPDMDGHEVCRRLKAATETSHIPVIFVTGKGHEDDEVVGFELGAVDYIRKPFHSVVVRARVLNHLKLKLQSDVLREMAMLDGLTGIPNRRSFDQRFEIAHAHARREQNPLSLLMIDVDHFKKYNDFYGNLRGDQCLRDIAQALNASVRRPHDQASRFGGEEFAVLLPDTDEAGALNVAQQLQVAIEQLGVEHQASEIARRVTLSIGAATLLPTSIASQEQHLRWADEQLYRAKSEGRNRICTHTYSA
ncbi:Diguanylate cyclase (GGDEF) domain-containing protein [Pseudomonas sp. 8Z]|uniref:diguanylate cyclase n=1 Tax=Pseudomonas sp. 8Z TaxID=2653166 RepID=UPI0012F0C75D|nr:diguanylate cyclase [Pseudomonas sp. 8Z]VXC57138.1 Diguanylate cyclase (GGDEF) domain-containing protein [Pseudomonas sp. 8Z]